MTFLLGTHLPSWLARTDVPLFVSYRRLAGRRSLPRAIGRWSLDSGGFSELRRCVESCAPDGSRHGPHGWRTTPDEYVEGVRRIVAEVGGLDWASPQDWMVEPDLLRLTGFTVAEHQRRTVENFLVLRSLAPDLPFVPVLQGWTRDDYQRCIRLYDDAGVDLRAYPVVGVGSVCRRQHTDEIGSIVTSLAALGLSLHGFGVKQLGLRRYGRLLRSADSMAWSFAARRGRIHLPDCEHKGNCNNCLRFALRWRASLLDEGRSATTVRAS